MSAVGRVATCGVRAYSTKPAVKGSTSYRITSTVRRVRNEAPQVVSAKDCFSKMSLSAPSTSSIVTQNFDNFLILDFEATCEDNVRITPCQEIIEFPVIRLCAKTFDEVDRFHTYVRPTERPMLTSFCTSLTGIVQGMVDDQPTFSDALQSFDVWMKERDLDSQRTVFVTCGDWDLKTMLPSEAKYKNITLPRYFDDWINIKKSFCDHRGYFARGLMDLLKDLDLKHQGRHHSGIDDVINIAAVTKALATEGYLFKINGGENMPKRFPNRIVKH